jgi:hypothetical protein
MAAQHPMHRRRRHTDHTRDPGRAQLASFTESHNPPFEMRGGLMRAPVRSTRSILEPGIAFVEPTSPPLVGGLTRHAHLGCHMATGRPAAIRSIMIMRPRGVIGALPCTRAS